MVFLRYPYFKFFISSRIGVEYSDNHQWIARRANNSMVFLRYPYFKFFISSRMGVEYSSQNTLSSGGLVDLARNGSHCRHVCHVHVWQLCLHSSTDVDIHHQAMRLLRSLKYHLELSMINTCIYLFSLLDWCGEGRGKKDIEFAQILFSGIEKEFGAQNVCNKNLVSLVSLIGFDCYDSRFHQILYFKFKFEYYLSNIYQSVHAPFLGFLLNGQWNSGQNYQDDGWKYQIPQLSFCDQR